MDALEVFMEKVGYYASHITTYGTLNLAFQVILSFCPAMFKFLSGVGWVVFAAILGLSIFHYRLFHVFFVLMLLSCDLPDEKDKSFWRSVGIFSLVVFLWLYLGYLSTNNWVRLL